MSGFGGWTNPNGTIHSVRPGDTVINCGTNMSVSSFCGPSAWPDRIVVVTTAPLDDDDYEWAE